jgi:hypothetical protein
MYGINNEGVAVSVYGELFVESLLLMPVDGLGLIRRRRPSQQASELLPS